ncbi:MAG: DUF2149 domain-containing protein [Pseudomonadota bacterium]
MSGRGSLSVLHEDDDDPMLSAVNLVDVFLVLVVALLTAVAAQRQSQVPEGATVVRNAGKPDMEIVVREKGRDVHFKGAGSARAGQGTRAGVAYTLEDGTMVYMPEAQAPAVAPPAAVAPGAAAR